MKHVKYFFGSIKPQLVLAFYIAMYFVIRAIMG